MRRLGTLTALAIATAAAAPSAASAQSQISVFSGGGSQPLTAVESSVKVTGSVSVDFHGDEASGCAAAHVCDMSGTVTWDPGRRGDLFAFSYRSKGRRFEDGFLALGGELAFGGTAVTSARVRRTGSDGTPQPMCADAAPSVEAPPGGPRLGSSLKLRLLGDGEVLRTRCAGPLTSDVGSLMPARVISERALRRGNARLDFSADGEFAAHGLAGTLHSDVVLRLGKATDALGGSQQQPPKGTRTRRVRFVQVSYRVERVSGQVVTSVQGLADPDLCGPLDSCGLLGSITTTPSASSGDGYLVAYGSAKHSKHEMLRSLGLVPGAPPRGVQRFGGFSWAQDSGSVTSDLSREGAPACTDAAPLAAGGAVDLAFSGTHATAVYSGGGLDAGGDPLRTRCPGPSGDDVGADNGLAEGGLALRSFAARHVTLRLTRGGGFEANGYAGSTRADLTVVVRRTRIRQQVLVEQVVDFFQRVSRRVP
jgi:hypothetical protein